MTFRLADQPQRQQQQQSAKQQRPNSENYELDRIHAAKAMRYFHLKPNGSTKSATNACAIKSKPSKHKPSKHVSVSRSILAPSPTTSPRSAVSICDSINDVDALTSSPASKRARAIRL